MCVCTALACAYPSTDRGRNLGRVLHGEEEGFQDKFLGCCSDLYI